MTKRDDLEIQDTSGLTDADWTEINKLRNAHKNGGKKAFAVALDQLAKDPIRYAVVIGAFYPDMCITERQHSIGDARTHPQNRRPN